jgi:hypothetical protein
MERTLASCGTYTRYLLYIYLPTYSSLPKRRVYTFINSILLVDSLHSIPLAEQRGPSLMPRPQRAYAHALSVI